MEPIKNPFLPLKGEWKSFFLILAVTVVFLTVGFYELAGGTTLNLVGSAIAFAIVLVGLVFLGYILFLSWQQSKRH